MRRGCYICYITLTGGDEGIQRVGEVVVETYPVSKYKFGVGCMSLGCWDVWKVDFFISIPKKEINTPHRPFSKYIPLLSSPHKIIFLMTAYALMCPHPPPLLINSSPAIQTFYSYNSVSKSENYTSNPLPHSISPPHYQTPHNNSAQKTP